MSQPRRSFILPVLLAIACGADPAEAPPNQAADASSSAAPLHEVACTDQSISQLMLFEEPSPNGVLSEESNGAVFETVVDASAGGTNATQSFVYARFTDQGLQKVPLSDEDAFTSGDWHIAIRRYVLRLNSGVSGPGSVTGARTTPETNFDTLVRAPDGAEVPYRAEQYFTENCDYLSDGGIGGPSTALASYWKYQECVQMTGNVFVLALPDGRHVKLQVVAYYALPNQRVCDETGKVPMPSGAGNIRLRWAFLD